MSDKSEEYEIIKAVCAAFTSNPVTAFPTGLPLVEEVRKAEAPTLGIVVKMENGEYLHPRYYQGELVMEMRAVAKDVESEAAFAGWCAAMETGLLERALGIKAALKEKGLQLCHLMVLRPEEAPDERSGFIGSRRWMLRVKRGLLTGAE